MAKKETKRTDPDEYDAPTKQGFKGNRRILRVEFSEDAQSASGLIYFEDIPFNDFSDLSKRDLGFNPKGLDRILVYKTWEYGVFVESKDFRENFIESQKSYYPNVVPEPVKSLESAKALEERVANTETETVNPLHDLPTLRNGEIFFVKMKNRLTSGDKNYLLLGTDSGIKRWEKTGGSLNPVGKSYDELVKMAGDLGANMIVEGRGGVKHFINYTGTSHAAKNYLLNPSATKT